MDEMLDFIHSYNLYYGDHKYRQFNNINITITVEYGFLYIRIDKKVKNNK